MTDPFRYADTYEWMEHVRSGLGPVVITCAVNGGVQGQESHPDLPETPEQIAEQVAEAYEAGASVVHIHPRAKDDVSFTSRLTEDFVEVNRRVREACPDIVVNNTSGGTLGEDGTTYFHVLDARPEMASLNCGPDMSRFRMAPRPEPLQHPRAELLVDGCLPWTYAKIEQLARVMKERDVKPELEVYHSGQFHVTRFLQERGLLDAHPVHQFVMGYQTSAFPTPENVIRLLHELPLGSSFFCAGIGPFQVPMNAMAMLLGGHVRVGLEDNLYYSRGRRLKGNREAVERAARTAHELGRPVATPAQARQILGVSAVARTW